ncbi:MAG: SDR family NAD(P)-dependent oxidoreductase [Nitrospirae bacterium]|nr:SDR family NAD(P)-dependent oxidoreductase [Nitrospirota bacterium]
MKLKGKVALVTGASRGIGRAIAEAYLREGAEVFACARGELDLTSAVREMSREGTIRSRAADVSQPDQVGRLLEEVSRAAGRLDVVVNNAGAAGVRVPIERYPADVWEEVVRVNVMSVFLVSREALPLMRKSGGGSIINVSSGVGRKGKALWGAYAVSKFAVEGFTQTLAEEIKPDGIRVNSVNPGATRTRMRAQSYPNEDPMTLPTPESLAPMFVYLASDDSRETGQYFEAREWLLTHGPSAHAA